jgi:hypothetical protein
MSPVFPCDGTVPASQVQALMLVDVQNCLGSSAGYAGEANLAHSKNFLLVLCQLWNQF